MHPCSNTVPFVGMEVRFCTQGGQNPTIIDATIHAINVNEDLPLNCDVHYGAFPGGTIVYDVAWGGQGFPNTNTWHCEDDPTETISKWGRLSDRNFKEPV